MPFHHQYLIAQIIKGLLVSSGNQEFRNYSYYSFSGIKGQIKVNKNGLQYTSRRVTIVISSASPEFMEHLVDLVIQQEEVVIGDLSLTPEIAEEELPVSFERGTKYVCISPLILLPATLNDSGSKQFLEPSSDDFSDLLYENTVKRMTDYGVDLNKIRDAQKFQLVPDETYLEKLKATGKKFSRVYPVFDQDVKHEVRGYTFPFTLYAAPEIQDFVFTCGLGTYCCKGFGMLDLANADPTERTVVYKSRDELVSA